MEGGFRVTPKDPSVLIPLPEGAPLATPRPLRFGVALIVRRSENTVPAFYYVHKPHKSFRNFIFRLRPCHRPLHCGLLFFNVVSNISLPKSGLGPWCLDVVSMSLFSQVRMICGMAFVIFSFPKLLFGMPSRPVSFFGRPSRGRGALGSARRETLEAMLAYLGDFGWMSRPYSKSFGHILESDVFFSLCCFPDHFRS